MDSTPCNLVELSNRLDKEGKKVCADAVDNLIREESIVKIAQYVGVIGYVLKQERAMANCIRRKRVGSDTSMQDVVLSCLKEYQDGQDYNDKEWTSKYAQVVQQDPSLFSQSHLVFLAGLGKESDIERHITNLETTTELLEENNASDKMLSTILSHIKEYGEILKKEASNVNFKLAAPQGWWSRLWQNVNPWSKKWRERGEDKKAVSEMDNILERVVEVGDTTRQMKHSIQQLKAQFGSLSEMIPEESSARGIANQINKLGLQNWENLSASVYQLQYIIQNTPPAPQEQHMLSNAANVIWELSENVSTVNDSMRDIQINMNLLRQRPTIRGRYSKFTEEGETDPRSISSPAEEFGVLDRVLSRLYKNPFDQEAYFYAQRMHARLEDKLRYIEKEPDQGVEDWLQTPDAPDAPEPSQTPETSNDLIDLGPVDDRQIKAVIQSLMNTPIGNPQTVQDKAKLLKDVFTQVFAPLGLRDHPKLKALKDTLIEVARNPAHASQSIESPESAPESAQTPASTTATPATPQSSSPGDQIDLDKWGQDFTDFGDETDPFRPRHASLDDLIKIATEIDPIDRNLSNLIDKYIKEMDLFALPEFPECASVIKDDDMENISNTDKKAGHAFSVV